MSRAKIGQRFTVVLPRDVREGLAVDDPVDVVRREDGVIEIRPQMLVDKSQAWFWSPDWQAGERQVDADYAAGRYRVHESGDAFVAELERRRKPAGG